jgi:hypothetical protein
MMEPSAWSQVGIGNNARQILRDRLHREIPGNYFTGRQMVIPLPVYHSIPMPDIRTGAFFGFVMKKGSHLCFAL